MTAVAADYVSRRRTMPPELHGSIRGYLFELWRGVPPCELCGCAWALFAATRNKYARAATSIERETGRR